MDGKGEKYNTLPVLFHWSSAFIIFVVVSTGFLLRIVPLVTQRSIMIYHTAGGITLLIITTIRLLWSFIENKPPIPEKLIEWQKRLYSATHPLLYVFVFINLITGGLFLFSVPLEELFGSNESVRLTITGFVFTNWHRLVSYIMIFFVVIHSVGVLWYQLTKGDVMSRMSIR